MRGKNDLSGFVAGAIVVAALGACGTHSPVFDCDYTDSGSTYSPNTWDGGGCDFCWDAGPSLTPSAIRPSFGTTTNAARPPPPISGGTLLVTHDGHFAVVADPDRDFVYVVDMTTKSLAKTISLVAGDEPGRLAEDGRGLIYVALRGAGAVVTLDIGAGTVVNRMAVCPAPRGVTWDAGNDRIWVACATGELVSVPATGGVAQSVVVERDLRDVIVSNGNVTVSKLRSAELLHVAIDGSVTRRDAEPGIQARFAPHVAWRTIAGLQGQLVVVHQLESLDPLTTHVAGGYGGCNGGLPLPQSNAPTDTPDGGSTCSPESFSNFANVGCEQQPGAVLSAITVFDASGGIVTSRAFPGALPVDVAMSRDGAFFGVVAAGDGFVGGLGSVILLSPCGDLARTPLAVGASLQPTAIAFDAANNLVVQTREPATLTVIDKKTSFATTIPLSTLPRSDTGHAIFHTQAGAMIACASCHPEGGDDGHTWLLDGNARRTPSLRGTVALTAPYHWSGEEPSLDALIDDVYTLRMDGAFLASDQKLALGSWIKSIDAPRAPSYIDPNAAMRGSKLFADATVGCAGCHSGTKMTNNMTVDVGTGGAFQVPSLIGVGWRAPFLHDGCAATMSDRFGKCATPHHGEISGLSPSDVGDLVAFLETR